MNTVQQTILAAARQQASLAVLRGVRQILNMNIRSTRWCLTVAAVLSRWAGDDPELPPAGAQWPPKRLAAGGRHSLRKPARCRSIRSLRQQLRHVSPCVFCGRPPSAHIWTDDGPACLAEGDA